MATPAIQQRIVVPELVAAAQDILLQGLDLLEAATPAQYSHVAPAPFKASIGGHYRHVLEHFICLRDGAPLGLVNYDARQRNPRIENESAFAASATRQIMRELLDWPQQFLDLPCRTVSSVAYTSADPSTIDSNLGRELAYCIGHAIHHYAIIRLLCSHVGVDVPADFGYAPSTLKHESSLSAD